METLKTARNKSTIWPNYTTHWQVSKGFDILFHKYLLNNVHCALFTINRKWKQLGCLSANKRTYTMEYYVTVKKSEMKFEGK